MSLPLSSILCLLSLWGRYVLSQCFYPSAWKSVWVLFSAMASGLSGGWLAGHALGKSVGQEYLGMLTPYVMLLWSLEIYHSNETLLNHVCCSNTCTVTYIFKTGLLQCLVSWTPTVSHPKVAESTKLGCQSCFKCKEIWFHITSPPTPLYWLPVSKLSCCFTPISTARVISGKVPSIWHTRFEPTLVTAYWLGAKLANHSTSGFL